MVRRVWAAQRHHGDLKRRGPKPEAQAKAGRRVAFACVSGFQGAANTLGYGLRSHDSTWEAAADVICSMIHRSMSRSISGVN